ncbi:5-methyltetrahydropteroyltriglutamate--homocysteine S-methyltransferase [Labrys sp. WJW]|uniref:5-methyltetrahydropteroyltriglutamate-- homocysteine S-methyltransferase n=1 Tax=Labrys sp. WJW TaxID=1737983 RepID=UPI000830CBC9|nr:5-methyltetrahydropteroyltriglutamate--homocysteine S-methyltransferase [Labrys sp. WJW]OCC01893.1 5-methyltetrahydropteroyltriglutamate--homocysteine S-methyltransferase [Labrys sp. WJW]
MSIPISTLGTPRIGPRRELKTALEAFWAGKQDEAALLSTAAQLRASNWARQSLLGVTHIPSNDFSLYDQVLDMSATVGAIPRHYGWEGGPVSLATYFAMARGSHGHDGRDHDDRGNTGCSHDGHGGGIPALEMTKWFDTNYHYMVPEFRRGQAFELASTKPIDEFTEAATLGFHTHPVLIGPVTYLLLGKGKDTGFDPLALLPGLLPVYAEILRRLAAAGADWVQLDEPCLVLDLDERTRTALRQTYDVLAGTVSDLKIMVASYFGGLGDNLDLALALPAAGLHLDLARAPEQLGRAVEQAPADKVLSLGVIDGRNVWRSDLTTLLDRIEPDVAALGAHRVVLAPSCSLLHVPYDLALETELDPELGKWLAFAVQKIGELKTLATALVDGRKAVGEALGSSDAAAGARRVSDRIHNPAVADRMAAITPAMHERQHPYPLRRRAQEWLGLPSFPTTTIGSFPQTDAVRKARADHAKGRIGDADYHGFLRQETAQAIAWQEEIGLDVLVHGEFERNDMVQYFGEQLAGYAFTGHGWVQSYGSRCVRPPIIYGDVSRPRPMTVDWARFAQSLTRRPVKGMLTGPVTMLQWSFVRDDIEREQVCRQIALALRDEVGDLEQAGIRIIQIDEPAIREGLPLRHAEKEAYLAWAVACFRLTSSGVDDATQIHTHMCYSEFNDIIHAVGGLDADVISIETARSRMELLDAFRAYRYPNEIGPGVYDIHSPRCPGVAEMRDLLTKAQERIAGDQLWVNPDCGLKTRSWAEVRPALANMVVAARQLREETTPARAATSA